MLKLIGGPGAYKLCDIGTPGGVGFGVGTCPSDLIPTGMVPMAGCYKEGHGQYGNYLFEGIAQQCFVPIFFYRIAHASNPTYATYGVNSIDVKGADTYALTTALVTDITAANPAVVTTGAAHGRTAGDYIWLSHITADANWAGYSGKLYKVGTVGDATHFNLQTAAGVDVDASGVAGAFSSVTDAEACIFYTGAEADGYALPRAFIDGGKIQRGFFFDKFMGSKQARGTGYAVGSLKGTLPLSSAAAHNPFSGCTGGENAYYSAIDLAHRRDGVDGAVNASSIFHSGSIFQRAAIAMLSTAHGQAAAVNGTGTTNCAWYHATKNYPKGLNNNQAPVAGVISSADVDDTTITFESDGYSNCGKSGSGSPFAKTTHNGQTCGIADVNGLMWEISIGATCIATSPAIEAMTQENPCKIKVTGHGKVNGDYVQINGITQAGWSGCKDKIWTLTRIDDDNFTIPFDASGFGTPYDAGTDPGTVTIGKWYVAKEATSMKDFTAGATLATDHWGATGVAAMMQEFTPAFETSGGGPFTQRMGSGANQVLAEDISGAEWLLTGMGFPKAANGIDTTGTDLFGKDYFYQHIEDALCLGSSGSWYGTAPAGVWYVGWGNYRTASDYYVGFRAACYPS